MSTVPVLDADALIARAVDQTKLSNFGAPTYREGLERFVASLNAEAALSPTGHAMAEGMILGALVNRLRIEDWWTAHPELAGEQIERPIFIVGMSRSGTTALSHLLGRDPNLRCLLAWESTDSVPPPETARYATDPRFEAAKQRDAAAAAAMPEFRAYHYDPPDAPMECVMAFNHEFNSSALWTTFHVPTYMDWTLAQDATSNFAWHARMLALLQSRKPGRWCLKAPQHATTLAALRARYPDAKLILTHRDPTVCAASTMSLAAYLHSVSSSKPDPKGFARRVADFIGRCADDLIAWADRHGDSDFIHVPYARLVAEPLAVADEIAAATGHTITPAARAAMERHVRERTQHRYGVHRYALEDYGFRREELDERYQAYRERFGVPLERKR